VIYLQLDKVVAYHKALADPTRIKMLILLADGELKGQVLAEKICVSPATITHHAAKLREASLIHERRDKNTIYFSLNHYFLKNNAGATLDLIMKNAGKGAKEDDSMTDSMTEKNKRLSESVIKNFFTADGRLKHIPAQYKKKLIVLERLAGLLEAGRKYAEREINEFLTRFHEDYATLRRELIMHQYMYREKEIYELNPREMWTKWEEVR
jgi:hypothetical protein